MKLFKTFKIYFIPCLENIYRPKFLDGRFFIYFVVFLILLKLISFSFLLYFPKTFFFADLTKNALIKLTNESRGVLGLLPLKENPQLEKAAELKAMDMFKNEYFAHTSPSGVSPWYWVELTNYNYQYAGENLAIGFMDSEEVYYGLYNSPSHRANLLNSNYTDIGIAIVKGNFQNKETYIVVQIFGSEIKGVAAVAAATTINPKEKPVKVLKTGEAATTEQLMPKETVVTEPPKEVAGFISPISENLEPKKSIKSNVFQFLVLNYDGLISKIVFYSLIFLIILLAVTIFVKFNIQYPALILKTTFVIVLLLVFSYLDKIQIINLIPHLFLIH